jgi:hypothetical protein
MSEYSTTATVDGELIEVVAEYDVDGYEPLVYGIFAKVDEEDLTLVISEAEFDRIYEEVSQDIIEQMNGATEQTLEYFNQYIAGDR